MLTKISCQAIFIYFHYLCLHTSKDLVHVHYGIQHILFPLSKFLLPVGVSVSNGVSNSGVGGVGGRGGGVGGLGARFFSRCWLANDLLLA